MRPAAGRGRPSATARSGTSTPRPTAAGSPRCCRRCSPTGGPQRSTTSGWSSTAIPSSSPSPSGSTTSCTATPGDGGRSANAERAHYERVLAANVAELGARIGAATSWCFTTRRRPGMVDGVRATGARVVWRCHIGRDTPTSRPTGVGVPPALHRARADAFVFSRREYAPDWVDRSGSRDPAVDRPVLDEEPRARSADRPPRAGDRRLLDGPAPDGPVSFERRDGTAGTVRRRAGLHRARPAATGRRPVGPPGQPVGPAQGHGRRPRRRSPR